MTCTTTLTARTHSPKSSHSSSLCSHSYDLSNHTLTRLFSHTVSPHTHVIPVYLHSLLRERLLPLTLSHSHGVVLPPSVFSPMCSHTPTHTHTHQSLCSLPLPFTSFSPNPTLAALTALTAIPHTLPIPPTPFHPIMPPSHHHHISTSTLTNRCQSPPITSIPSPEHFAPFHFALRQKSDRLVNP